MLKIRLTATIYFAFQGIAVILWWILLFLYPQARNWFQMGDSEMILMSFWLPDLLFLGIGSLAVSFLIIHQSKFLDIVIWFVVGAFSFAELYCLLFALQTDSGWLGVVLMFPAVIMSGNFALALNPAFLEVLFRESKDGKTNWLLTKTLVQIIIIWILILAVIPQIIVIIESKLGIKQFNFPFQTTISLILFIIISLLGIWSAVQMAKFGRGTPLPMDTTTKLVITGMYKYVRNPMAVSGIGQGLAVALYFGSPLVAIYAVFGAIIWQLIFRPLEEDDLMRKFGTEYKDYQQKVRCWIPRFW